MRFLKRNKVARECGTDASDEVLGHTAAGHHKLAPGKSFLIE